MHNLAQLSMAQNPSVIGSYPAPVTVTDVNHFIFAFHLWEFVVAGAAQADHSRNLSQSCHWLMFVAHLKSHITSEGISYYIYSHFIFMMISL